jgi:hypothetical protein
VVKSIAYSIYNAASPPTMYADCVAGTTFYSNKGSVACNVSLSNIQAAVDAAVANNAFGSGVTISAGTSSLVVVLTGARGYI